jgi:hypothetical protein
VDFTGERAELFGVLRVKRLYENYMRDLRSTRFLFYDITPSSKKGTVNYEGFRRIWQKCMALGIEPEDYIRVMVAGVKYPFGAIRGPFINFLASDGGFKTFTVYYRRLHREHSSSAAAKTLIKKTGLLSELFRGCFYNGFLIMRGFIHRVDAAELDAPFFMLGFMLAFKDVFTPAFIATHSVFMGIMGREENSLTSDEREMKMMAVAYSEAILKRTYHDSGFAERLFSARDSARNTEKNTVRRFGIEKDGNDTWRKVWSLLD